MSKPTRQLVKALLKNPDRCPSCDSVDLYAHDYDGAKRRLVCAVRCQGCGLNWVEKYDLVEVAGVEMAPPINRIHGYTLGLKSLIDVISHGASCPTRVGGECLCNVAKLHEAVALLDEIAT